MNKKLLFVSIAVFGVLALLLILFFQSNKIGAIDSFEKCVAAGYPIMESYPEQCRTPDGKTFVNENAKPSVRCTMEGKVCPDGSVVGRVGPNCEFAECPEVSEDTCYIGGCSRQVCSDQPDVVTTCEYKEEYLCYQTAKCVRQSNGECGWTKTAELTACLAGKQGSDNFLQ